MSLCGTSSKGATFGRGRPVSSALWRASPRYHLCTIFVDPEEGVSIGSRSFESGAEVYLKVVVCGDGACGMFPISCACVVPFWLTSV